MGQALYGVLKQLQFISIEPVAISQVESGKLKVTESIYCSEPVGTHIVRP